MRKLLLASVFTLVAGAASAQSNNLAFIEQTAGVGNTAYQEQAAGSNGNQARAYQQGTVSNSTIRQTQEGTNNNAMATQNGNGSNNRITQSQVGTNLKANALQTGGSNNQISQTQVGTAHTSYAYQGGGSGNITIHDQNYNGGDANYNRADSRMTDQVNSRQYVTQNTGGNNFATQVMTQAGTGNIQQIIQSAQGNVATQILR